MDALNNLRREWERLAREIEDICAGWSGIRGHLKSLETQRDHAFQCYMMESQLMLVKKALQK
jgi:hypothetical protein